MKRNYIWLLLVVATFVQCSKSKLSPVPVYKASAGTPLDSNGLHLAVIGYDTAYTYILDNRYGYQMFYKIRESDGQTEVIPRFGQLGAFMVTENYVYGARKNIYPLAFSTLCRYNKYNFDDSVIIIQRMIYSQLSYLVGYYYGLNKIYEL